MIRDYSTGIGNGVEYFVGYEIENTKFKGLKTLFVAKKPNFAEICEKSMVPNVPHVYIGGNHFFQKHVLFQEDLECAANLIEIGYRVTLDIPIYAYDEYLRLKKRVHFSFEEDFCLTLSVPVPHIDKHPYIHIKIDDTGFRETNPGVWVFSIDSLPKETFNDWSLYKNDGPVKTDV